MRGMTTHREPTPTARPTDTRPVRTTVDMAPDRHRQLKLWAVTEGVSLVDVWRALADELAESPDLADRIRTRLTAQ